MMMMMMMIEYRMGGGGGSDDDRIDIKDVIGIGCVMSSVYYDWNKTFSYDAKVNMIISARGFGKTYGIRKACIKDFLKDGSRFVEIVRTKTALSGEDAVQRGYFDKIILKNEFPNHEFMIKGTKAYIREVCSDDVKNKNKWELIGYFVALSGMQQTKQRTFTRVKKVIFDEFIVYKKAKNGYLPGEFGLFSNLIDSLAREEVDENGNAKGTNIHIYMLGNACDLTNPYFIRWKINKVPKYGYSWHSNKLVLIHYTDDETYSKGKKDTLVGKLVAGTSEENIIVNNMFNSGDEYNIEKKTKNAKFQYGIIYCGNKFGVWYDLNAGVIFINSNVPENSGRDIFALTKEDNTANYLQVRNSDSTLRNLMDLYYADIIRFESIGLRDNFLNCMNAFGLK